MSVKNDESAVNEKTFGQLLSLQLLPVIIV